MFSKLQALGGLVLGDDMAGRDTWSPPVDGRGDAPPHGDSCVPRYEICNNNVDDDCDKLVDCDDTECSSQWKKNPSGKCVPGCVLNQTCNYNESSGGDTPQNALNKMASGLLEAQRVNQKNDGIFHFAVISDPHITDDPGVNSDQPAGYTGTFTSKQNPFAKSRWK